MVFDRLLFVMAVTETKRSSDWKPAAVVFFQQLINISARRRGAVKKLYELKEIFFEIRSIRFSARLVCERLFPKVYHKDHIIPHRMVLLGVSLKAKSFGV